MVGVKPLDAQHRAAVERGGGGGAVTPASLQRVRTALASLPPDVAAAAAVIARHLLPGCGALAGAPVVLPPGVGGGETAFAVQAAGAAVGCAISPFSAPQLQEQRRSSDSGTAAPSTAAADGAVVSPAASASGGGASAPRRGSLLGVSLSVDVSAADSHSSDDEEEQEEQGAEKEQDEEEGEKVGSTGRGPADGVGGARGGPAAAFAQKLARRPPTPGAGLGELPPASPDEEAEKEDEDKAAKLVRKLARPAAAGAATRAAELRGSWEGKLAKRPPTPGAGLAHGPRAAAKVGSGGGGDNGGSNNVAARRNPGKPAAVAGGSSSEGICFSQELEAVKIITQPEFDPGDDGGEGNSGGGGGAHPAAPRQAARAALLARGSPELRLD